MEETVREIAAAALTTFEVAPRGSRGTACRLPILGKIWELRPSVFDRRDP
jgi:hypothetical protein